MISIINPLNGEELFEREKGLVNADGEIVYKFRNGAYRIVSDHNYADNFGFEWNTFQRTQIDRFSGNEISKKRFFAETGWTETLENINILEVGSGAGRFSQIILDYTKATLYSVDFSNAVEANYKNNGPNERLKLFQASVYDLPFKKNSFDKVICLGVLQHTPDFKKSVECLIGMVKPGGEIIVDFYPIKGWYTKFCAKYLLRPLTKKMSNELLMKFIKTNIDWLTKLSKFNTKIHLDILNRFLPICDIKKTIPAGLSSIDLREWLILDTFDMFSPEYDNPQKLSTVTKWFSDFGLKNVEATFVRYDSVIEAPVVKGIK